MDIWVDSLTVAIMKVNDFAIYRFCLRLNALKGKIEINFGKEVYKAERGTEQNLQLFFGVGDNPDRVK